MIKNFLYGIVYHVKGLSLGVRTTKLLLLGILRFVILAAFTVLLATLAMSYHDKFMNMIWAKPESIWVIWIWHFISWLLTMLLLGISTVISYLISQICFSVIIMDYMSKITEQIITNQVIEPQGISFFKKIIYLIKQEIPRTIFPVILSIVLFIVGWLTPFGPIVAFISSLLAIMFLSWDNSDLVPARRLKPFKERFRLLMKNLPFHIGFGLFFLVPILNSVFFSFAPVGATMYYLEIIQKNEEVEQKK